jgi:glycerol-3-phosphate O-acyltransferase
VLGPPTASTPVASTEKSLQLQSIGAEIAWRINGVTPITATALLTLTLLGALGRALTHRQVRAAVTSYVEYATSRELPMTESASKLVTDEGLRAALEALVDKGVVLLCDDGPDTVYVIGAEQHLAAAFYRNSIVHHFLDRSIAEVALVSAAEPGVTDPTAAFWDATTRFRDLLQFDFFFSSPDELRGSIAAELSRIDPAWIERIGEGAGGIGGVLRRCNVITAPLTLRSFFEAYSVVALALERHGDDAVTDLDVLVRECHGLGRQRRLQQRIHSPESVSRHLFATGIELADHQGLLREPGVGHRLSAFALEMKHAIRQLDGLEAVALEVFGRFLATVPEGVEQEDRNG